jgi:hypothetical protein
MGKAQKTILAILATLTLAALAAVIFTWQWADYRARLRAMRSNLRQQESLVDTRALGSCLSWQSLIGKNPMRRKP